MSTAETPNPEVEAPVLQDLTHWQTPIEKATTELSRHADRLLPGAVPVLAARMAQRLGSMDPDVRAEAVESFLASPLAQKWHNPEAPATPLLPNGQAPSELRTILARYPEIKPERVETLVRDWSSGLAGKTGAKLVGEVVRRLGQPEAAQHLRQAVDKFYAHNFARGNSAEASAPAKAEASRAADGRFAEPPAKPKRTPSTSF